MSDFLQLPLFCFVQLLYGWFFEKQTSEVLVYMFRLCLCVCICFGHSVLCMADRLTSEVYWNLKVKFHKESCFHSTASGSSFNISPLCICFLTLVAYRCLLLYHAHPKDTPDHNLWFSHNVCCGSKDTEYISPQCDLWNPFLEL